MPPPPSPFTAPPGPGAWRSLFTTADGDEAGAGDADGGSGLLGFGATPSAAALAPFDTPRPLHQGIRSVWRLAGALSSVVLALVAAVVEVVLAVRGVTGPLPAPLHALLLLGVALVASQWYASARFRGWAYALGEVAIVVDTGVFWRFRRTIPRARVQHVDVHSGPLDRLFGLAQVSLYTAGSMGPVVTIPGLSPEEAAALRDALVARSAA